MPQDNEDQQPDVYAAEVVPFGPETGAIVSVTKIVAGDLTSDHVGKFVGFHTEDYNYSAKIRRVQHFDQGKAPGVSVWLRTSALPEGTPARDERMHVPFDTEIELIDMIPFSD
jgi:hypothetical protein